MSRSNPRLMSRKHAALRLGLFSRSYLRLLELQGELHAIVDMADGIRRYDSDEVEDLARRRGGGRVRIGRKRFMLEGLGPLCGMIGRRVFEWLDAGADVALVVAETNVRADIVHALWREWIKTVQDDERERRPSRRRTH